MASGSQVAALTGISQLAEQEYLRLLQAPSAKAVEDRIVLCLNTALSEKENPTSVPIRLSTIADRFLINPNPKLIRGRYDGEIEFDESAGAFVITLCTDQPNMSFAKLGNRTRLRFTYAHEIAHRFFYVSVGTAWRRARDLATERLRLPEQMEQRITLGRLEERLCNKIAARVLIPDSWISNSCDLQEWFADTERFCEKLSNQAKSLGVSRDCLMIRLRETESRCRMGPNVAFLVGRSYGSINKRAAFTLRVLTALSPYQIDGCKLPAIYPGMEIERFGEIAAKVLCDLINRANVQGTIHVPLWIDKSGKTIANLNGCWNLLSAGHTGGDDRILLWGKLTIN